MVDWYARADEAAAILRETLQFDEVSAALVLGSGWEPAVQEWGKPVAEVATECVPHFTGCVAPGHSGRIAHFDVDGTAVLAYFGRTHLYEGCGVGQVVHAVRTAASCGARRLVLTNANGALRTDWPLGQVVLLTDHINLTGLSPLEGARFVDLTDCYDPALRTRALSVDPGLVEGVYAMLPGPHFETPAEARMIAGFGADVLGMSTVLETIAAREFDMHVAALSIVTAHEATGEVIDPDEVVRIAEEAARRTGPVVAALVTAEPTP